MSAPRWTRQHLLHVKRMISELGHRQERREGAGAEPGAFANVLDYIDKQLTELPDILSTQWPEYGAPVRVACGATGRYLANGTALVRSAQDNDLFLDAVDRTRDPMPGAVLPGNDELAAAHIVYVHFLPGAF